MAYLKPALRRRHAVKCDADSDDAVETTIVPRTKRPRRRPRGGARVQDSNSSGPRMSEGGERQVHFIDESSPRSPHGPVTATRIRPRTTPRERSALFYQASDYAHFELEEARRTSRGFGWEDLLPVCFGCDDGGEGVEVGERELIEEEENGRLEDKLEDKGEGEGEWEEGDLAGMLRRVGSFQEQ